MAKSKFIQYVKYDSDLFFMMIDEKQKIRISVNLYDFDTGIHITNSVNYDTTNMVQCTKLEFDKAYNLALALLTNRAMNK